MTPLRRRMIEDMTLRDLAPKTQDAYVHAAAGLSRHYGRSPEQLTEEQVRAFFLHLIEERELSPSSVRQYVSGIKFLYTVTLRRNWNIFELTTPKRGRKLPVVLSRDEVRRLIGSIREPRCRAGALCGYLCGLRLSEIIALRLVHIDFERMQVRVLNGKGKKDRNVPLPERLSVLLHDYMAAQKLTDWLFPSGAYWREGEPMSRSTLQRAVRLAGKEAEIPKNATVHTLRHCYATHLLECGVDLRVIQHLLGHRRTETTAIYTHLTDRTLSRLSRALDEITEGF